MVMIEEPVASEAFEEAAADEHACTPNASWAATIGPRLLLGFGSVACLVIVGGIVAFFASRPSERMTVSPSAATPPPRVSVEIAQASHDEPETTPPQTPPETPPLSAAPEPTVEQLTTSIRHEHSDEIEEPLDPLLPAEFQPDPNLESEPTPTAAQPETSLAALALLLEGETAEQGRTAEPSPVSNQGEEEIVGTAMATTAAHTDSRPIINIEAQLNIKLKAIQFQDKPLIEFLRCVMELAHVPVQLDPRALRQTGVTTESLVTVSLDDVSVGEVLRAGLAGIGLTHVVEPSIVRVTSRGVEVAKLEERAFKIGDILRTNPDGLDLPRLICALVEPTSWSANGGPGEIEIVEDRLVVNQTRDIHVQTILLLEKLRIARGLRPRVQVPASYTRLESAWGRVQPKLSRQISVNAWQPQRFVDMLHQIEAASDLRILVDWRGVIAAGWSGDTVSTLVVRDVPVEVALRQLLGTAGLVIRPINDRCVEVTTTSAVASRHELEFYRLDALGASGLARLQQLTISEQGVVAFDRASDTALVVAPSAVHRELAR
jgi:hypothetical protein